MADTASGPKFSLRNVARALKHRNYRLFFSGQSISLIGTWMQQVAVSWLIYRLTGSAFLLGIVSFANNIPVFIGTPFTGVLADRWNRHKAIVIIQIAAMVQAFILAVLVLTNLIQVWEVIALGFLLGVIGAFDMPFRQAFIVEMVEDRDDLSNAIALNSTMFNSARLLGPSIAGLLVAALGEGWCFLLNGISYIPVIWALLLMKPIPQVRQETRARLLEGMKEGFKYAFGFPPIRTLLVLLSIISLIGMPYTVLMPMFAKTVLHGSSDTYGFLLGASGVGALVGAILLASRKSVRGLGRVIGIAAAVFGVGLIALSFSRMIWLSLIIMVATGYGMIVQMAASNTVLQTIVEDKMRGRVMSFYTMSIRGIAPFGGLIAGAMAAAIGAPNTFLIGGACVVLGSIWFAKNLNMIREHIRPIYIKKGIVPVPQNGGTEQQ